MGSLRDGLDRLAARRQLPITTGPLTVASAPDPPPDPYRTPRRILVVVMIGVAFVAIVTVLRPDRPNPESGQTTPPAATAGAELQTPFSPASADGPVDTRFVRSGGAYWLLKEGQRYRARNDDEVRELERIFGFPPEISGSE